MQTLFSLVLYGALGIHILLMLAVTLRLWKGENAFDRLMASDLLSNLLLAVLVLAAMIHHQNLFLDVALGLAALGFISAIAYARYIANKKMF